MNSLLEILPDVRLNDLSAPLRLAVAKLTDHTWAARLAELDQPFRRSDARSVQLIFDEDATRPLALGGPHGATLALTGAAAAHARLTLVWPDDTDLPDAFIAIREAGLLPRLPDQNAFWVVLDLGGTLGAKVAGGTAASTALSASFDLDADGRARFVRVLVASDREPATRLLARVFTTLRWPLAAPRGGAFFSPGEVSWVETVGDLSLGLTLRGGYQLEGLTNFDLGQLPASLRYQLAARISVSLGFTLGGAFQIATTGSDRGASWIRLRVQRGSSRGIDFGVGIDLAIDTQAESLPEDPFAVLGGVLGVDLAGTKNWLDLLASADSPAALSALAGTKLTALAQRVIGDAATEVFGDLTSHANYQKFQAAVAKLQQQVQDLPEAGVALLTQHAPQLEALVPRLEKLLAKLDAAAANFSETAGVVALVADELDWLEAFGGSDVLARLADPAALAAVRKPLAQARDLAAGGIADDVRAWLESLTERTDVQTVLETLDRLDSPEELKAFATSKLTALAQELIAGGLDFAEAKLGETLARVQHAVRGALALAERLRSALAKARDFEGRLSLAATFGARRRQEALIDLEIDLATVAGRDLAAAAYRGSFADVLTAAETAPDAVQIHACALTRARERHLTVAVSAFGWSFQRATKVLHELKEELVATEGGLVCLYTATSRNLTTITRENARGREVVQASLLLQALAEKRSGQPAALTSFDLELALVHERTPAPQADVARLLRLAQDLALVERSADYAQRLTEEFGDPVGALSASYHVAYTPDALRTALLAGDDAAMARVVIQTIRAYVAATHTNRINFTARDAQVYLDFDYFAGHAELPDDARADALKKDLTRRLQLVHRGPAGRRGALGLQVGFRNVKLEWYLAELEFLRLLRALRDLLRSTAPFDPAELQRLSDRLFALRAPWLDLWGSAVAFLIFDRLIQLHDPAAREGRARLELALTDARSSKSTRRALVA